MWFNFFRSDDENDPLIGTKPRKRHVFPCAFAAVVACQLSFLAGISQGYSAILLAQLEKPDSLLRIDQEQASWIASLGTICRPVGALVEGYMIDKYGRKTTMQIVSILISLAWILTYFSRDVVMLYISRILLSFALGMVICVGLYIAEISKPTERGTLLSLITPLTIGGTLVVYILGYLFFWRTVALILFAYCLVVFGAMFFIPETYIWHMMRWDRLDATKSLMWLRRDSDQVEREIEEAEDRISRMTAPSNYLQNFKDPAVWKPFLILVVFSAFQQQVGYNIITYYAVDFFSSFESQFDGNVLSIVFAALSTVSSLLLMTVVHKFKRKTLLAGSGMGMTVFMVIGAISLSVEGVSRDIPILCVFAYIMFCMLGMIDIPWMMVGEMFPTRVRGSMCANVTVVIFVVTFFNVKMYPFLNNWLGVSGLFWYFAIFSFLTVVFSQIFFPETKDKSLFEIEEQFRK